MSLKLRIPAVCILLAGMGASANALTPIPAELQSYGMLPRVYVGPRSKAEFPAWLAGMKQAREKQRRQIEEKLRQQPPGFKSVYDELELDWAILPHVKILAHDRCLYDRERQVYTVEKCLDDYEARYGGVGRVTLWPHYPNSGIDSRNQFDFFRDMPGGIEGLRGVVETIQRRGIRVCIPYAPWDKGTRPEPRPDEEVVAELAQALGADCINGDTMIGPERKYYAASLAKGRVIPWEPELGFATEGDDGKDTELLEALYWTPMSWAYAWEVNGTDYPFVPGVDRFKWIEPRHVPCVTYRNEKSHLESLQFAFFNGACFNAWENIFGEWNGLLERDAEALRRITAIYRAFPSVFRSPEWEPHTPTLQDGVFASRFPGKAGVVYTLVNRHKAKARNGAQLSIPFQGQRFFDLWNGQELKPVVANGKATLSFDIEPLGFGAVFVLPANGQAPQELQALLSRMRELSRTPLASYASRWQPFTQQMVGIARTAPRRDTPPEMVRIQGSASYPFKVRGLVVETYNAPGVQFPWEQGGPAIAHAQKLSVPSFLIDRHLVTNQDFQRFLQASGYAPKGFDRQNFLKHWSGADSYPTGTALQPVVWVSLEDARAYCAWAGKRLPNDWEWQYAAQGGNAARIYPWGNNWNAGLTPKPDLSRTPQLPGEVGRHPHGASGFGVQDLVGHVWQWTNEFQDKGNRRALLRGGSYYHPQGSQWYFRHTYIEHSDDDEEKPRAVPGQGAHPNKINEHGNYLLMAPSLDRAGTIGFRCAADLES